MGVFLIVFGFGGVAGGVGKIGWFFRDGWMGGWVGGIWGGEFRNVGGLGDGNGRWNLALACVVFFFFNQR